MTNLLKTGSNWLEGKRKAYAASTVTYSGRGFSVDVEASIGTTTFDVETAGGGIESFESRDFLILATDLRLGGPQRPAVTPARGDRIKELSDAGDETFVYEVMAPGGEPPWRYSDAFRKALRVHTKLVGTE